MKEELEDRDVNIRNLKAEIADKDRTIQDLRRAVSFRSGVKGESYSSVRRPAGLRRVQGPQGVPGVLGPSEEPMPGPASPMNQHKVVWSAGVRMVLEP